MREDWPVRGFAHVWVLRKYGHHLPLYRQQEIYEREGVELYRATLADWVGGRGAPTSARGSAATSRDERDETARRRHADSSACAGSWERPSWTVVTYVRDVLSGRDKTPPAVWFAEYCSGPQGRASRAPEQLSSAGLEADGYAGLGQLYASGRIQEAACWAHVRREVFIIFTSRTDRRWPKKRSDASVNSMR